MSSSHLGQVDFLTGQELFHSHFPNRQGLCMTIKSLAGAKSEKSNLHVLRFAHGKQNLRST